MTTYAALLRAINVGGRNQVPMAALRELHTRLGHRDVVTYIQSGNVVFDSDDDPAVSAQSIETAITDEFGFHIAVVIRTPAELQAAAHGSPYAARFDPAHVAIAFLKDLPEVDTSSEIDSRVHSPDEFVIVGREIHLHCPNGFGHSKLNNAWLERRLEVVSTIRNWRTVSKLLTLCDARSA